MKINWLIVGAGFAGCVLAERIATQLDQKVLVVERRDHIGGNAHDYYDEHGILVHKYGPHIFHTNLKKVWSYLSQFTDWRPYYHQVLAVVEGKKVPVPFNLNSLRFLFPPRHASNLEQKLIAHYGFQAKVPILQLLEAEDSDLKFVGKYVYDNVYIGYTLKQWEAKPEDLDPSVTARVPVYISRDDRYFQDAYQAIPKHGYTEMFRRMLQHPNIKVLLNTDYQEVAEEVEYDRMIYTGAIDEFFGYTYGELPYRSLWFEFECHHKEFYQEVAQVNYPNEYAFTRVTEFKHMTGQISSNTTVTFEYPQTFIRGINDRYYPVPSEVQFKRYNLYREDAQKLNGRVIFIGRLADYKYYNMDEAISRALFIFERGFANG